MDLENSRTNATISTGFCSPTFYAFPTSLLYNNDNVIGAFTKTQVRL